MKMGFYPTPVEVVEEISKMLNVAQGARLIDTCCGEGEALKIIAKGNPAETYGVELDRERFLKARENLDHVLWADALHEFVSSRGAFSLLWLNPPYDTSDGGEDQERTRLEVKFLKKHWPYLQNGGVLVYIAPFMILQRVAVFFQRRCKDLAILSFPDKQYWNFKQVVVICVKERPRKDEATWNMDLFQAAIRIGENVAPDKMPTTADAGLEYQVPPSKEMHEDFVFRSFRLDPDEALESLKTSPVWDKARNYVFPPAGMTNIRPLMPLREGHLAMLLASGMMNGEVIGDNGQRLIVKGSVKTAADRKVEETKDTISTAETTHHEITVRAICFDPLEIVTIE